MSSVMSFSDTPESEIAPCCVPPCPGPRTILLTDRGNTARLRRRGAGDSVVDDGLRVSAAATHPRDRAFDGKPR